MALETVCQSRDMGTSGCGLIEMFVAVASARVRLEHPKYGKVVSDQFDEADSATS